MRLTFNSRLNKQQEREFRGPKLLGIEFKENLTPHTKIKNMRNRMFIPEFISLQVSPSDRASELGFGLRKSPFLKSAPSHARRHLSKRILPAGAPKNARKRGKGERKRETQTNTNRRTLRRRSAWALAWETTSCTRRSSAWRHSS